MNNPQKEMAHLLYIYFENNDNLFTPYDLLADMSRDILELPKIDMDSLANFIAEKSNLEIEKVHFHGSDYLFETMIEKLEAIRARKSS